MRISVVVDSTDPDALVDFWSVALAYRPVGAPAGYRVLVPADGEPPGPVLVLQRVPEPKVAKNRAHVDVHPPAGTAEEHVQRLEALGGSRVGAWVTEVPGVRWQVMADPHGNELCVVEDDPPRDAGLRSTA
jgi:catechol 2,3-dioxygenase-like lactoylglutathione lyase family enzyme